MRIPLFVGSALALIAAYVCSVYFIYKSTADEIPYTLLASPDLYVRAGDYQNCGHGDITPTNTFLIKHSSGDFVLIDAGSPGAEHSRGLVAAVKSAVGAGKLRLLLLTHGHNDHVGALPALTAAYPDLQVVFHTEEAPYLRGTSIGQQAMHCMYPWCCRGVI
jgi:glyoxylase-like metal-dependent hydrolase (beta-lactamase superfamily II)